MTGQRRGRPAVIIDRYTSMDLEQLRAEVHAMFGVTTSMAAPSALRFRLRRGHRAIAAGRKPEWRPRTHRSMLVPVELAVTIHGLLGVLVQYADSDFSAFGARAIGASQAADSLRVLIDQHAALHGGATGDQPLPSDR